MVHLRRLSVLFFAALAAAQVPPEMVDAIKREGLENSKVMDHLAGLTGRIGHRLTGSPNLVAAAEWARAEFEKMGVSAELEQWGEWKHAWNREQWSGRVIEPEPMELQVATEAWTAGTMGAVTGRLLPMPSDAAEIDQRAGELRGAWLFDTASVPDYEAQGGGRRGGGRRRGDGGVAEVLEERAAELGIHGLVSSSVGDARYPNRIRVFGRSNVAQLPAAELPTVPRVVVRYDQAKQLQAMLEAGKEVVVTFDIRNRFLPGPVPLYNVVAEIPGTELPDEYVYVSSHLDSWHQATGTTDNGTGTATTMEAARILAAVGAQPKRTIRFGLWGGEEQGLMGSRAHVQRHRTEMENVSAAFNHDTGTNWASGLSITAAMEEDMNSVFAPVMSMTPPDSDHDGPVFELRVVEGLSGGGSDHASFLAANVPGLNWNLSGRSDYFGYTWHSQWDTYDVAIPEYQAHTATVIALAALGTANLPHKLGRDGLRAAGGRRGDATAMLEGYLGGTFDGLKVKSVTEDGMLAKAGVKEGDLLVALGETKLTELVDLFRAARDMGFSGEAELTVRRGDEDLKVKVELQRQGRGRRRRGD